MSIPVQALAAVVTAGHPESALVGVPISLLREILSVLPVAVVTGAGGLAAAPSKEGPSA